MKTLKQPELGQTIQSLRQSKKMTQEELVEVCNLNVRTLQRIEAGEVTPRDYTIRAILSALEYEFEEIEKSLKKKQSLTWLKWGWIGGIIYFALGIVEVLLDFSRFDYDLPVYFPLVYTSVKLLTLASFSLFMIGFVEVGKIANGYLVQIGAYILLGMMAIIEIYDVVSLFSDCTVDEFLQLKAIEGVIVGGVEIIFGIGLFRMGAQLGIISKVAGVMEIVIGAFFLTLILGFVGLFLLIPATIIEIALIYKCYAAQKG